MNSSFHESIIIKIQGFKTYKETTIIGPFYGLLGLIGPSGSGKTNIIEGLEFLFSVDPKDYNIGVLNQLFFQNTFQQKHSFIKISLILKTKNLIYEFGKIVNYTNVTEYFLNNTISSFKKFAGEISRLKFNKFKKTSSILKLNNEIFLKPNLFFTLIQNFSDSNEILTEILKAGFLIQRLQENYFFYSNKLKFIVDERFFILKNLKKLQKLESKKHHLFKKQNVRNLYKIQWFATKNSKGFGKIKQKFRVAKEILINKRNLLNFLKIKKSLKKKPENQKNDYIFFQIKKLINFVKWLFAINQKQTSFLLNEYNLLLLKQLRCKNKSKSIGVSVLLDKKKLLYFQFRKKLIPLLSRKSYAKFYYKHSKLNLNIKGFFFYFRLLTFFNYRIKKLIFTLKKKTNVLIFYFTISLVFLLSDLKYHNKNKGYKVKKKEPSCFRPYTPDQKKIRGNILKIIKPLDSKFRSILRLTLFEDKSFFLVDTSTTAQNCLKNQKLFKNRQTLFYPINSEYKKKIHRLYLKNQFLIKFDFDYDEYDFFIPNLFHKVSFYQMINLNNEGFTQFKGGNTDYIKYSSHLRLIQDKEDLKKLVAKSIYQIIKFKAVIKNIFKKILVNGSNFEFQKKLLNQNFTLLRISIKFLNFGIKRQPNISVSLKNIHSQVGMERIYYFKKKLFILNKFLDYLRKKRQFKISTLKINNQLYDIMSTQTKLLENFIVLKRFNSFQANQNISRKALSIFHSSKLSCFYFFLIKKNLNSKLKKFFFFIKFLSIYTLLDDFFKKKTFSPKKKYKTSHIIETKIEFYIKKTNQIKIEIRLKNSILLKMESIINSIYISNPNYSLNIFIKYDYSLNFIKQQRFIYFFIAMDSIFSFLRLKTLNVRRVIEIFLLKKSSTKKFLPNKIQRITFDNHFNFLEQRFADFKNKMVKNRKNFFIVSKKKKKMIEEKEKKFGIYFQDWSKIVRIIYKNLTATFTNPLGGSIFFEYISPHPKKKGEVVISIFPVSNILKSNGQLSQREHSLFVLTLFIAFNYINAPSIIILDDFDTHLDPLNLEKFFWLFKKLEKKKKWASIIVTKNNYLKFYFFQLLEIYKQWNVSKVHLFRY